MIHQKTGAIAKIRAAITGGQVPRDPFIEYQPIAKELRGRPPSIVARGTFWFLVLFVLSAACWSWIGRVDVVAVANGKTIPVGKSKVIQPLEAGTVRGIRVRDGQRVSEGDVLVELDQAISAADRRRLQGELAIAEANHSRLIAAENPQLALKTFQPSAAYPKDIYESQKALLLAQVSEYLGRIDVVDADIQRNRSEQLLYQSEIDKIDKALPLLQERHTARQHLADVGYGSKMLALELKQRVVEMEHELQSQRFRLAMSKGAVEKLGRQRQQITAEYLARVAEEKTTTERQLASIKEELSKAETRHERQVLTAPISGVVQQLMVHTIGGVVTPAQNLMTIVPEEEKLEAEVAVLNKDVGFVEPGQEVDIKIEAFQFTKYGTLPGRLMWVSRDATHDENMGFVFLARVELLKSSFDLGTRSIPLGAGMTLSAEIKTDNRRIIDYLLSPLMKYRSESLRER